MSDLQLRQDVLDELEFDPRLNAANIGVAAEKGVVTLTGHVASYAERIAAIAAAQRVRGAQAIADNISVRLPSDKKSNDDEIAKRALDILTWHTSIPSGIKVTVRDGWITLAGQVDWYYQKQTAETAVRALSGVHGVINNVTIKPRVHGEDVKFKIESALKRHAEVEAKAIRVSVKDSKVILEGKVDSWDERYAAENAAWAAPGVTSVDDRLTVVR
jgi:osmotically-inducible protein OsmY